jgi:hypothetical protein
VAIGAGRPAVAAPDRLLASAARRAAVNEISRGAGGSGREAERAVRLEFGEREPLGELGDGADVGNGDVGVREG